RRTAPSTWSPTPTANASPRRPWSARPSPARCGCWRPPPAAEPAHHTPAPPRGAGKDRRALTPSPSRLTSMSTYAARYAEFRRRQQESSPTIEDFQALYGFEFDDFQVRACKALETGHGVLVAAPTGSGKTVVGEFAVHLALRDGRKCFYTTPIKALSNQKYTDLVRRYGAEKVGLLTGDNSINGEAPVVVMTTEVLRNMLYAGSTTLSGLAYVVMDEVHYLADRFRGAVWEEVIIHLPESVQMVALSATVSNAEEFGQWLQQVRGDTSVIVDEKRPVPLWQHMMVGTRIHDLFVEPDGAGPGQDEEAGGRGSRKRRRNRAAAQRTVAGARRRPPAAQQVRAAQPGADRGRAGPGGPAARHHLHLQPRGLRRRRAPVRGQRPGADHPGRGRRDPRVRRTPVRRHPPAGP